MAVWLYVGKPITLIIVVYSRSVVLRHNDFSPGDEQPEPHLFANML